MTDNNSIEKIQAHKIREALATQANRKVRDKTRAPTFDALLDKVSGEMEALKGQTDRAAVKVKESSDGIREPEALKEALQEAGRNFKSVMKLKNELVEAYNATLKQIGENSQDG